MVTMTPLLTSNTLPAFPPLMARTPAPGPRIVRFLPMSISLPFVGVLLGLEIVPLRLPANVMVLPAGAFAIAQRSDPTPSSWRLVTRVGSWRFVTGVGSGDLGVEAW